MILRPWSTGDAPDVARAYEDPDIRQWHARSMSEAEAVTWLRSRAELWSQDAGVAWAVTAAGDLVGRVGLGIDLAAGLATVGYWVIPSERGRGIATNALRAACDWSFTELGLHRLELEHATGNAASCAVATKSGFVFEGIKRKQALHLDGWHDMHLHSLLAEDPQVNSSRSRCEAAFSGAEISPTCHDLAVRWLEISRWSTWFLLAWTILSVLATIAAARRHGLFDLAIYVPAGVVFLGYSALDLRRRIRARDVQQRP